MQAGPVLVVHGGAGSIPGDLLSAHESGIGHSLAEGWKVLGHGGTALDAVETAVCVMEDDEAFDAGRGSFLNRDGRVQMDALIMDGNTLRAGGVGCVERIRNPIKAARLVLEKSPHVYFVAGGAERFAAEQGVMLIDNSELITDRERQRFREQAQEKERLDAAHAEATRRFPDGHDTVGAIALDSHGNLAAASSTGGTANKTPGRVGDSSLIGCGCYADNQSAAVCLTGWGEPIMKLVLGKWAADRVAGGGEPQLVAQEAMGYLDSRLQGRGGIIVIDRLGRHGIAHNSPKMPWGIRTADFQKSGTYLSAELPL